MSVEEEEMKRQKCEKCKHSAFAHMSGKACAWMGCGCKRLELVREVGTQVEGAAMLLKDLCVACGHERKLHQKMWCMGEPHGAVGTAADWCECEGFMGVDGGGVEGTGTTGVGLGKFEFVGKPECVCGHPVEEHVGYMEKVGVCVTCVGCTGYVARQGKAMEVPRCEGCGHRRMKHAWRDRKDQECEMKGCGCKEYKGDVGVWYGGGTGTAYVSCSHKPFKMLDGGTWSVWGGTRSSVQDKCGTFDVLLNCSQMPVYKEHEFPQGWGWVEKWRGKPLEVNFNWPDQGVVGLPAGFWLELRDEFERSKSRVLAFCVGGHGRTGTCLAALMIACGYGAKESMKLIRAAYCKKAVETMVQERWLGELEKEMKPLLEERERGLATVTEGKVKGKGKEDGVGSEGKGLVV